MAKDWTGNANSIYKTLGASNHTDKERDPNDYYATDPIAAQWLIRLLDLDPSTPIWECAAGENHLADAFRQQGFAVRSSDIVRRKADVEILDFLSVSESWPGHIITNPPYKFAIEFVQKALSLVSDGNYVCMFLKVLFLEGKRRKILYTKHPPLCVLVSSGRILCAKNGDFQKMIDGGGSSVAYAWFVWRKGYQGDTTVKWFN